MATGTFLALFNTTNNFGGILSNSTDNRESKKQWEVQRHTTLRSELQRCTQRVSASLTQVEAATRERGDMQRRRERESTLLNDATAAAAQTSEERITEALEQREEQATQRHLNRRMCADTAEKATSVGWSLDVGGRPGCRR